MFLWAWKHGSYVMSTEVVKTMVYNKVNVKVNNLENNIPDPTTLININQCNKDE